MNTDKWLSDCSLTTNWLKWVIKITDGPISKSRNYTVALHADAVDEQPIYKWCNVQIKKNKKQAVENGREQSKYIRNFDGKKLVYITTVELSNFQFLEAHL